MPAPTPRRTVLVTGAAGRLGRATCRELLLRGHLVRAFDRLPAPHGQPIVGDTSDRASIEDSLSGADALIHLAATPDDDDFSTRLLPDNILGLHAIIEAARACATARIVLASSGQVNWTQQLDGPWPVTVASAISPRGWYAVTKVALEAAGFTLARDGRSTVIAARLGWCPRTAAHREELAGSRYGRRVYLSPGDAGRFCAAAATAPVAPGFHLLFATSQPDGEPIFDLEPAARLLAWTPVDRWPAGASDDLTPA